MRVMALDVGTARCGVAVSDSLGMLATPTGVIEVGDGARLPERIAEHAARVEAGRLLVGLPLELDGTEGPRALAVRRLAEKVRRIAAMEVELVDERFTTVEAENRLEAAGHRARDRKGLKDAAAAAVMLQWWLDAQPR
jgi:putative Holliday junction resolvase